MNIRPTLNLDRTFYTVIADGEMLTFATAEEARHDIASMSGAPFAVAEWNVAEGRCFDVTPDFIPDDDAAEEEARLDRIEAASLARHERSFKPGRM